MPRVLARVLPNTIRQELAGWPFSAVDFVAREHPLILLDVALSSLAPSRGWND
jgi:hypothetical protein